MTVELAICVFLAILVYPVSKSIFAHYVMFALANLAFIGVIEADSSLLAMVFAVLAIGDMALASGRRYVLLLSAALSSALCVEQILNQDFLLSNIVGLSAAINIAIVGSLVAEYEAWMRGKFGR